MIVIFLTKSLQKKILISHSIQSIDKFIRKKQLLPYLRHKPKLTLLGKYHLTIRNYFTRMFGFFLCLTV